MRVYTVSLTDFDVSVPVDEFETFFEAPETAINTFEDTCSCSIDHAMLGQIQQKPFGLVRLNICKFVPSFHFSNDKFTSPNVLNQSENLLGLLLDVLHDDPDQLDECNDECPEGDRPQVVTKHSPHTHLLSPHHFVMFHKARPFCLNEKFNFFVCNTAQLFETIKRISRIDTRTGRCKVALSRVKYHEATAPAMT